MVERKPNELEEDESETRVGKMKHNNGKYTRRRREVEWLGGERRPNGGEGSLRILMCCDMN
jgi:hypothetical protein